MSDIDMARVNNAIWSAVMEGTAWCGWRDHARELLVKNVQDAVAWALEQPTVIAPPAPPIGGPDAEGRN